MMPQCVSLSERKAGASARRGFGVGGSSMRCVGGCSMRCVGGCSMR